MCNVAGNRKRERGAKKKGGRNIREMEGNCARCVNSVAVQLAVQWCGRLVVW